MKEHVKILIFEEKPTLAELLQEDLRNEGIRLQTEQVATVSDLTVELSAFSPDVILANHSMPGCDALAALAATRQESSHVPFIIMCSLEEADVARRALRLGATDYVLAGRMQRLVFAVLRALRDVEERADRNRAFAALQEMEERYRALFDRSLDGLYVHDFEGRFLDANPAALAMLGYSREEIPSVNFQSLLSPDQLHLAIECLDEIVRTGTQKHSKEFTLKHKNGNQVVAEVKGSLILRKGKPFAIQGIARDTTNRKRAEMELRRMNRFYAVQSHVNLTLIRARAPEELLQQVCSLAVEPGGFQSARILKVDPVAGRITTVALAGGPKEIPLAVPLLADDRPEGQGPSGITIREGIIAISNDFPGDARGKPWKELVESSGVNALASFPIYFRGKLYGALILSHGETNVFQREEVALLTSVAEAVSYGLDRLEREAQRIHAEKSLKAEQEAMRRSDARYRRVVQETGQVVYDYDLASGRIEWEGAMLEVLGYNWAEMQGIDAREWEERVHAQDRELTLAVLDNAIIHGQRFHVEYRFRRKDGVYIFVDEHGSFLRDESGRTVRMLGTMSDITERKNTEDRIREQARLLDLAHDAILARNLDDTIVYWNSSAKRLYGWTNEEVIGQNVGSLFHEDPSKSAEAREAVLQHDEWNGELVHFTKDGGRILVETRMTLVRDRQGKPKSILSINSDITARRALEAQLLRSQRMESIGTLASGIAHDLNNVLAPILMSCKLLSSCEAEGDRQEWIDIISRNAQRGADLVKQVLSFCRGAEGRRMQLRVTSVIGEVQDIARQTFPKSIQIQTRLSQDLWNVVADPTQLHQVLLNLVVNARDAMPNGGVLTVGAENVLLDSPEPDSKREATPRPHLMIIVADTGTGIPPEIREKIFDPFFTTKEVGKGTGLGLSTSLGIIKSHGGFINVYSEPGAGTVFKVYIPAMVVSPDESLQSEQKLLPRGNGELVLLVDDEAAVRTITAQTLRTFGYNVITAADGAEALELYGRHGSQVAVILMDMMMPVMDGPTTIHALGRRNRDLHVIAASGLSSETHMAKSPSDAVKAFLQKPYTAETLLKTVHQVLLAKAPPPSADEPPARNRT
jgi:PAS domain S-box-containing protein